MNETELHNYSLALLSTLSIQVIIPLLMFFSMFWLFGYLFYKAQKSADFNLQEMFKNDKNKVSVWPVVTLLAFAVTTWRLAVLTFGGAPNPQEGMYFLLFWSGAAVVQVLAKRWNGVLPWGGGGAPTPPEPPSAAIPLEPPKEPAKDEQGRQ